MPRFFFHVHDDLDAADEEGLDLPDLHAAKLGTIYSARALMCETLQQQGRIVLHHRIDIEDEQRRVLDSVVFGDVVRIEN